MIRTPRPVRRAAGGALLALPLLLPLASPAAAVTVPTSFVVENAVPGVSFTVPTSITFMPDGRYFVTEKRGRVLFVTNGVVSSTPVLDIRTEVLDNEDRGLLSLAVDPQFATNRTIYLLYTVDPDLDGNDSNVIAFGRLTRYTLDAYFVADPASRKILIGDTWTNGVPIGSTSHTIGTLRWGQDGSLLVSAGDGASFTQTDPGGLYPGLFGNGKTDPYEDIGAFRAQSLSSLAGKILRINPVDGSGYPSNPFWDGNAFSKRSRIWCYGLRNPFRFNIRPGTGATSVTSGDPGTLFIGEVGLTTWEEANVATTGGKNFGWPCYEGRYANSAYQAASPAHNGCGSIGTSDNPAQPTLPPIAWHHSDASAGTPPGFSGNCSIGGTFYSGAQYPSTYRGRYFFADYGQNWIRSATFDGNDQLLSVQSFGTNAEGPVDLESDPITGDVFYVSIVTGQVRRIRYTAAGGNAAPIAAITATPEVGPAPLGVQFSSTGTFDPDGDPLVYSWSFGDGQGSTSANPVHTFTASGLYSSVLTVSDNKGGVSRDTVTIYVSAPGGFPSTAVLDDFNRADGPLGGSWSGTPSGLVIAGGQLAQTGGYASVVWNAATFGPTQEASVALNAITGGATEHDLMLKVQGLAWESGHIEVRYDAGAKTVTVSTYESSQGWVRRGGPYSVPLVAGDRLGARAYGDGTVEVYKNSTLVAGTSVTGWPYATSGGRVGMTISLATQSRFDNFSGGNSVLNTNTPPVATIIAPPPVSYYVAGDPLSLSGSATDGQDPVGGLQLRWEVDLLHNNHVHPQIYSFTGPTGAFVGENHDDGTGVYYLTRFIATDTGGLKDTATTRIYPQIDLRPASLQTSPSPPADASPTQVSFTIQNLGGMPAPLSRWQLRVDATSLAVGDTIVPGLGSVTITRSVGPLAGGAHTLRATVDTLGQVVETVETNNVTVLAVSVTDGTPPAFSSGPTAIPASTSAVVAWTTNEAATGAVRYGPTPALGDSVTAASATSQSRTLSGLARNAFYYYRVAATDAAGNTRLSTLANFTTLANRPPIASAGGTPTLGPAPLTVQFSSAGSSDPDGDPIAYAWSFGDGGSSTAASPSHLYAATGTYTATLMVSDAFGGSANSSVQVSVAPAFPSAGVLDGFNRANGAVGGSWTGQTTGLSIGNNRLVQSTSGWNTVLWNGAAFGPDQEAYVTIAALTSGAPEHDLVLKVQGTSPTSGQLEVRYDDSVRLVKISTYTPTGGWVNQGTINQTFAAGDVLGARAYASGAVDVFRNGARIGGVSVTSWPSYALGGRIGLTLGLATASALDNFGGGNVSTGPDVTPPAFASGPTATPASNSAQIAWTTTEPATGSVRYGLTTALGDSALAPLGSAGNVTLSNLSRGALYNWRVAVTDAAGNTGLSSPSTFQTLANRAPVAAAAANPSTGTAPLAVQFSSAGSSDPDGDALTYAWAFGDGGTSSLPNPSHTYNAAGGYVASLTVSDGFGGSNSATATVTAQPPGSDVTPPAFLTGPSATPSTTSALVSWTTDEAAAGSVRYGTTIALGDSVLTPLGTSGSATLPGLSPATLYYSRVAARDVAGNTALSALLNFTTLGSAPFPATGVLDNFNRLNGAVGGSWVATTTSGLSIASQQLASTTSSYYSPIWDGGVYGTNQEAYVTVATVSPNGPEHDLLLKVQGTSWSAGHIEVRYDDRLERVLVSTFNGATQTWTTQATLNSQAFASGDALGARAFSNGIVEVYRNGLRIGTASVTSWPPYAQGGRLGLTIGAVSGARFDNFGGGTLPAGVLPAAVTDVPELPAISATADPPLPGLAGPAGGIALSGAVPNPAHGPVEWTLVLPRAAGVDWEIVDLQGRSRWRESRELPAGANRLAWRPAGHVAPGVYMVVVRTAGLTLSRRFVVLP